VPLDEPFEEDPERVQRGSHTHEDQRDGEEHAHRGQRVNLAETYRRDRRDRLVQGVDKSEPEDHIAHSPGNDHQTKR
jgi:hypothetical protein